MERIETALRRRARLGLALGTAAALMSGVSASAERAGPAGEPLVVPGGVAALLAENSTGRAGFVDPWSAESNRESPSAAVPTDEPADYPPVASAQDPWDGTVQAPVPAPSGPTSGPWPPGIDTRQEPAKTGGVAVPGGSSGSAGGDPWFSGPATGQRSGFGTAPSSGRTGPSGSPPPASPFPDPWSPGAAPGQRSGFGSGGGSRPGTMGGSSSDPWSPRAAPGQRSGFGTGPMSSGMGGGPGPTGFPMGMPPSDPWFSSAPRQGGGFGGGGPAPRGGGAGGTGGSPWRDPWAPGSGVPPAPGGFGAGSAIPAPQGAGVRSDPWSGGTSQPPAGVPWATGAGAGQVPGGFGGGPGFAPPMAPGFGQPPGPMGGPSGWPGGPDSLSAIRGLDLREDQRERLKTISDELSDQKGHITGEITKHNEKLRTLSEEQRVHWQAISRLQRQISEADAEAFRRADALLNDQQRQQIRRGPGSMSPPMMPPRRMTPGPGRQGGGSSMGFGG